MVNNELVYVHTEDKETKQIKWAREIGIKILNDEVEIIISKEGNGEVNGIKEDNTNLIEGTNVCKLAEDITLNAHASNKNINGEEIEYAFEGWYKNGIKLSSDVQYKTSVAGDAEYIAKFMPVGASLMYYLDENGNEQVEINKLATLSGYTNRVDITKIEIGNNVKSIGTSAFQGCTSLKSVNIPKGCYIGTSAFSGCTSLETAYAPTSSWSGYWGAEFSGCTNLREVTLGDIGCPMSLLSHNSFSLCNREDLVIKIYVSDETGKSPAFGSNATNATIEYYSSTTGKLVNKIIGLKDKGNTQISEIEIPSVTTEIKASAFQGCTGLKSIDIPKGCYVWDSAFSGCTSLETAYAPTSNWGQWPGTEFWGCTNLKEVTLGGVGYPISNLPRIILEGCNRNDLVVKVYINDEVSKSLNFQSSARNATIEYYSSKTGKLVNEIVGLKYKGNTEISEIEIPNVTTEIKASAFQGCIGINNIILPESLTSIGTSAFQGCTGLKSIDIPKGCYVWDSAFSGCTSLETAYAPTSNWGQWPGTEFWGCTNLKEVTLGGVGYPISNLPRIILEGCNRNDLVVNIYLDENVQSISTSSSGISTSATIKWYSTVNNNLIN